MSTLETAIAIAVNAHRGQVDRQGRPYILHPITVMMSMDTDEERIVAILHDVVEDSPISLDDLREAGFSEVIVGAVDALTNREGESYEDFTERVSHNPLARRVKLGDLQHNMDIRRLPEITDKDLERLRKYRAAWRRLTGA